MSSTLSAVLCSHPIDKFLFTVSIIPGAEITHCSASCRWEDAFNLRFSQYFPFSYPYISSFPWCFHGSLFESSDTVKSWCQCLMAAAKTRPPKKRAWREQISIIVCSRCGRLEWWSGKHSSHCMVFVLWRTAAAMQITIIPSLIICYLFFRCEIAKRVLELGFSTALAHTRAHYL